MERFRATGAKTFLTKWFVALVLIAGLTGAMYEQVGQRRDRNRLPQIGRSVDIGGRSLNIFCSGGGNPAVILDAGAGDPGYAWSEIQPEIAKFTAACWFDRAGEGWSDPGPFPRTSATLSADLHELLQRAGILPPFVLVGHSLGGLNARVYNGMYPNEVARTVLVDAAHEDEPKRAPPSKAIATTLGDPTLPESYAQAAAAGGFGDRPLIVLTRGKATLPSSPTAEDMEGFAYEQVWMHEIQPKLARLSTRGRQIILEQSGHRIPQEAPEAVIAATREVVVAIRTQRARR